MCTLSRNLSAGTHDTTCGQIFYISFALKTTSYYHYNLYHYRVDKLHVGVCVYCHNVLLMYAVNPEEMRLPILLFT